MSACVNTIKEAKLAKWKKQVAPWVYVEALALDNDLRA